jgi:hypothetical protein
MSIGHTDGQNAIGQAQETRNERVHGVLLVTRG